MPNGVLGTIRTLRSFGLDGPVTDAGFAHIANLTQIQSPLTSAVARLPTRPPQYLAGLTRLRRVDLEGSAIGDGGLRQIAKLPGLVVLNLSGTKITDAGLAALENRNLSRLLIHNTAVTDAGMEHILKMKRIDWLDVGDTGVSDERGKELDERMTARNPSSFSTTEKRPPRERGVIESSGPCRHEDETSHGFLLTGIARDTVAD